MKRVVVILTLALGSTLLVGVAANVFFGNGGCNGCSNDSAPAELQVAFTGAAIFYTDHGSYSGIYDGNGVSTIGEMVHGLTFVSGQPSTGRNVISVATNPWAGWLVMAAYGNEARTCFIMIDQKAKQVHPVADESDGAPGIYYGLIRNSSSTACTASVGMAGTDYSTSGWPPGF